VKAKASSPALLQRRRENLIRNLREGKNLIPSPSPKEKGELDSESA